MKTQAAVIYEYKKPLVITATKGFTGSMNPSLLDRKITACHRQDSHSPLEGPRELLLLPLFPHAYQ